MEISVVLAVMVALASMVTPYVLGAVETSMCVATDNSLQDIRNAIMGTSVSQGYREDMGNMPTQYLQELFVHGDNQPAYDPMTRRGWNGPYLSGGSSCDTYPAICSSLSPRPQAFVMDSFRAKGTAPKPIQLLYSTVHGIYYLVSGGDNGTIDVTDLNLNARSNLDDRILVINGVDPGSNKSCNQ